MRNAKLQVQSQIVRNLFFHRKALAVFFHQIKHIYKLPNWMQFILSIL